MYSTLLSVSVILAGQAAADGDKVWSLPHPIILECGEHAASVPLDAPFLRYVIFPYADQVLFDWHIITVNMVGSDLQSNYIVFPYYVDPEGLWVAWDLRKLAPRVITEDDKKVFDVVRLMGAFEGIDDLSLQSQLPEAIDVEVATVDQDGLVVAVPSKRRRLLDAQFPAQELLTATQATTPVVTLYEFQRQIWSEDYYRFLGAGKTLSALLEERGWDVERSRELGSIARAMMARSGITRAPRIVEFVPGLGNRVTETDGLFMSTFDFEREEVTFFNAAIDPFQNALAAKREFGEHIFQRANGGWAYALDLNDELQQVVNAEVATDELTTHSELEVGISCVGCHIQSTFRGVQPVRKDLVKLFRNNKPVLIQLVAKKEKHLNPFEIEQQLLNYYSWSESFPDPDGNLVAVDFVADARDHFAEFCTKCSDGRMLPEEFGEQTRSFWNSYVVNAVTPTQACLELSLEPGEDPLATLTERIQTAAPDNAYGILPSLDSVVGREQWTEAKLLLYPRLLAPPPELQKPQDDPVNDPVKEPENEEADNPRPADDDVGSVNLHRSGWIHQERRLLLEGRSSLSA